MGTETANRDGNGGNWLAGTATETITPERSMWMAGFSSRDRPSEGVQTDLHAKALALEDGTGTRTVIVSAEILFVGHALRAAVAERCADVYGLAPRRLLLNATHTHQGPVTRTATDVDGDSDGSRGRPRAPGRVDFIPLEFYDGAEAYRDRTVAYRDALEDTLVDLVGAALDGRDDADLYYSHSQCASAMCRRRPTEDGITFGPYSEGPVDTDVPVLSVEDPARSGDPSIRALLFGYACHPTVQSLHEFSGDWPGYTQQLLEDRFPNATTMFLQGCGGNQKAYPQRELRYAKGHGQSVALAVEAALEAERRPVRGPLRAVYEETDVAFEGPPSREALERIADDDDHDEQWRAEYLLSVLDERGSIPTEYPYPIQAIGFGTDLTLVGLAGEVFAEYALQLKAEHDGPLWVAGYSNDGFTYVPTRRALAEGGYEADTVIDITTLPGKWKPDLEERILTKANALVNRVRTPPPR